MIRSTVFALALAGGLLAAGPSVPAGQAIPDAERQDWLQLFDGKDLKDWTPKFSHHDLGENYNDTFRVEDGLLKVRYDKWTSWNGEFGHIFYKRKLSYYIVAAEYRFVGGQVTGAGPALAWANRNNGIMAVSQSAESMGLDQD